MNNQERIWMRFQRIFAHREGCFVYEFVFYVLMLTALIRSLIRQLPFLCVFGSVRVFFLVPAFRATVFAVAFIWRWCCCCCFFSATHSKCRHFYIVNSSHTPFRFSFSFKPITEFFFFFYGRSVIVCVRERFFVVIVHLFICARVCIRLFPVRPFSKRYLLIFLFVFVILVFIYRQHDCV